MMHKHLGGVGKFRKNDSNVRGNVKLASLFQIQTHSVSFIFIALSSSVLDFISNQCSNFIHKTFL